MRREHWQFHSVEEENSEKRKLDRLNFSFKLERPDLLVFFEFPTASETLTKFVPCNSNSIINKNNI